MAAADSGVRFGNPLPVRLMMENNNLMNGSGVAAGDFDRDGCCDLYFAALDGTNALYRNLGGWRFRRRDGQGRSGAARHALDREPLRDTDGDGDLDLLVASLGRGVHAFENLGDGRFRDVTGRGGPCLGHRQHDARHGGCGRDGDLDLYVANYGALSILRSGGRAEVRQVGGQWSVTGRTPNACASWRAASRRWASRMSFT